MCDQWPSATYACLNDQGNQVARETFDALLLEKKKYINKIYLREKQVSGGKEWRMWRRQTAREQLRSGSAAEIYTSARGGVLGKTYDKACLRYMPAREEKKNLEILENVA